MVTDADIARLLPHAGASRLLDEVVAWDGASVHCRTRAHLDPANPLRRGGALHPVHGAEIGMQAAALHGGLRAGAPRPGWIAALRGLEWSTDRLDRPEHGVLEVWAEAMGESDAGHLYAFRLLSAAGGWLAQGRGLVALR